jgi:hypothetical protein
VWLYRDSFMKIPGFFLAAGLILGHFEALTERTAQDEMLKVGGGKIHVVMDSGLPVSSEATIAWVRRAATAVSGFLGHFPVKQVLIRVENGGDEAVNNGVTYGGARIIVHLGSATGVKDLNEDWILTHEMFHLAFPTLSQSQLWMMEGLSDYLEPVSRAQAGQLPVADVWKEMVEGLPQGLPQADDDGLDNTHTWARTYWGGEIFWLLADVQIRVKTDNRHSVGDAIRAILADGGNGGSDWTLARVLQVGDKATGTTVLKDLHDQLGPKPGSVNLPELWKKLGVSERDDVILFDDTAPWAKIRRAITAPAGGKTKF